MSVLPTGGYQAHAELNEEFRYLQYVYLLIWFAVGKYLIFVN